jgi:hypothetical protein
MMGIGHCFDYARRLKSASDSQSALQRTGRRVNLLQQVLHIIHRFQPVAQRMTNAH